LKLEEDPGLFAQIRFFYGSAKPAHAGMAVMRSAVYLIEPRDRQKLVIPVSPLVIPVSPLVIPAKAHYCPE